MNNRDRMYRRAMKVVFYKYKHKPIYELIRSHEHISYLIKLGRMNGRHDGYNSRFTMIDEISQYGNIEEAKRFYGL